VCVCACVCVRVVFDKDITARRHYAPMWAVAITCFGNKQTWPDNIAFAGEPQAADFD